MFLFFIFVNRKFLFHFLWNFLLLFLTLFSNFINSYLLLLICFVVVFIFFYLHFLCFVFYSYYYFVIKVFRPRLLGSNSEDGLNDCKLLYRDYKCLLSLLLWWKDIPILTTVWWRELSAEEQQRYLKHVKSNSRVR